MKELLIILLIPFVACERNKIHNQNEDTLFITYDINNKIFSHCSIKVDTIKEDTANNFHNQPGGPVLTYKYDIPIVLRPYDEEGQRKYIGIGAFRFNPDSLYYGRELTSSSNPIFIESVSFYSLTCENGKRYIVTLLGNSFYGNHTEYCELLYLFDITNKENIIPFCLGYTKCTSPNAFGEYTGDKALCLLNIFENDHGMDTLGILKVEGNKIERVEGKYLLLKGIDSGGTRYSIDYDNSKWSN